MTQDVIRQIWEVCAFLEPREGDAESGRQWGHYPLFSPEQFSLLAPLAVDLSSRFFLAAEQSELPSRNIWEVLLSSPWAAHGAPQECSEVPALGFA